MQKVVLGRGPIKEWDLRLLFETISLSVNWKLARCLG